MASLTRPALFSKHFNVDPRELAKRGLIDPILNSDTKVFIDPLLLEKSKNKIASGPARGQLRKRFDEIIRLLLASKAKGDVAWRAASKLLDLSERRETCLGFGGKSVAGSSRPDSLKARILATTREILDLGVNDPEIISLLGFLEDDVGPDTISDMATNAMFPALAGLTFEVCRELGIKVASCQINGHTYKLPINTFAKHPHGICLIPRDIVRRLPIAADMSDVARVAFENQQIRERVNKLIANFAQASIAEQKSAFRTAALNSAKDFLDIFGSLKKADKPYSVSGDPDGLYLFRQALHTIGKQYPFKIAPPTQKTKSELLRIVNEVIAKFKTLIETNDVGNLLWNEDQPRKEKAAQLLYFAVAEVYCEANNVSISPETHSGGGPVDFKFSTGYDGNVLVELKLSTGKVEHGYKTQLEVYRAAHPKSDTILIVIDVGGMGRKLKKIRLIQAQRTKSGDYASEIVVIDAKRKRSASVR